MSEKRAVEAFIFPTNALASDEEAYTYIHDTVRLVMQGRADLKDLDGIRQVAEIKRLHHQRRRAKAQKSISLWHRRRVAEEG